MADTTATSSAVATDTDQLQSPATRTNRLSTPRPVATNHNRVMAKYKQERFKSMTPLPYSEDTALFPPPPPPPSQQQQPPPPEQQQHRSQQQQPRQMPQDSNISNKLPPLGARPRGTRNALPGRLNRDSTSFLQLAGALFVVFFLLALCASRQRPRHQPPSCTTRIARWLRQPITSSTRSRPKQELARKKARENYMRSHASEMSREPTSTARRGAQIVAFVASSIATTATCTLESMQHKISALRQSPHSINGDKSQNSQDASLEPLEQTRGQEVAASTTALAPARSTTTSAIRGRKAAKDHNSPASKSSPRASTTSTAMASTSSSSGKGSSRAPSTSSSLATRVSSTAESSAPLERQRSRSTAPVATKMVSAGVQTEVRRRDGDDGGFFTGENMPQERIRSSRRAEEAPLLLGSRRSVSMSMLDSSFDATMTPLQSRSFHRHHYSEHVSERNEARLQEAKRTSPSLRIITSHPSDASLLSLNHLDGSHRQDDAAAEDKAFAAPARTPPLSPSISTASSDDELIKDNGIVPPPPREGASRERRDRSRSHEIDAFGSPVSSLALNEWSDYISPGSATARRASAPAQPSPSHQSQANGSSTPAVSRSARKRRKAAALQEHNSKVVGLSKLKSPDGERGSATPDEDASAHRARRRSSIGASSANGYYAHSEGQVSSSSQRHRSSSHASSAGPAEMVRTASGTSSVVSAASSLPPSYAMTPLSTDSHAAWLETAHHPARHRDQAAAMRALGVVDTFVDDDFVPHVRHRSAGPEGNGYASLGRANGGGAGRRPRRLGARASLEDLIMSPPRSPMSATSPTSSTMPHQPFSPTGLVGGMPPAWAIHPAAHQQPYDAMPYAQDYGRLAAASRPHSRRSTSSPAPSGLPMPPPLYPAAINGHYSSGSMQHATQQQQQQQAWQAAGMTMAPPPYPAVSNTSLPAIHPLYGFVPPPPPPPASPYSSHAGNGGMRHSSAYASDASGSRHTSKSRRSSPRPPSVRSFATSTTAPSSTADPDDAVSETVFAAVNGNGGEPGSLAAASAALHARLVMSERDAERSQKELEIARWKVSILEEERITTEIENQEALAVLAARAQRAEARIKLLEATASAAARQASSQAASPRLRPLPNGDSQINGHLGLPSGDTALPDVPFPQLADHPLSWVDLDSLASVNITSSSRPPSRRGKGGGRREDGKRRRSGARRKSANSTPVVEQRAASDDDDVVIIMDSALQPPLSRRSTLSRRSSLAAPSVAGDDDSGEPDRSDDDPERDLSDATDVSVNDGQLLTPEYVGYLPRGVVGRTSREESPESTSADDTRGNISCSSLIVKEEGPDTSGTPDVPPVPRVILKSSSCNSLDGGDDTRLA